MCTVSKLPWWSVEMQDLNKLPIHMYQMLFYILNGHQLPQKKKGCKTFLGFVAYLPKPYRFLKYLSKCY